MLVQISEFFVINTKDIEKIELSSVTNKWHVYTYNGQGYTLDSLYYSIGELVRHCNGDL